MGVVGRTRTSSRNRRHRRRPPTCLLRGRTHRASDPATIHDRVEPRRRVQAQLAALGCDAAAGVPGHGLGRDVVTRTQCPCRFDRKRQHPPLLRNDGAGRVAPTTDVRGDTITVTSSHPIPPGSSPNSGTWRTRSTSLRHTTATRQRKRPTQPSVGGAPSFRRVPVGANGVLGGRRTEGVRGSRCPRRGEFALCHLDEDLDIEILGVHAPLPISGSRSSRAFRRVARRSRNTAGAVRPRTGSGIGFPACRMPFPPGTPLREPLRAWSTSWRARRSPGGSRATPTRCAGSSTPPTR